MNKVDVEINLILTESEIRAALGASGTLLPMATFDREDVPIELRELIPYAVFWGIVDDCGREDVLKKTPESIKINLKQAISRFDDELDNWLSGSEVLNPVSTNAYIAFSAMRMAADSI
jgi:hypothetical protein